jgi:hypothetical protein
MPLPGIRILLPGHSQYPLYLGSIASVESLAKFSSVATLG